jgi:hypothetical protein
MTATVRDWLPSGAANCAAVRDLIQGAVASWAEQWFVRAEARATGFEARTGAAPGSGWFAGGQVAVAPAGPGLPRLACLALGAPADRPVLSEADRDILDHLAKTIARDLGTALETALHLGKADRPRRAGEEPMDGDGGLAFDVADSAGQILLRAAIPGHALVPVRKGAIKARRRRRPVLAPLGRSADATRVRVEARLGAVSLPLGEVARLSVGDVIVLDRRIVDGAELALGACGRPLGRGEILPGETGLSLILLPQD